MDSGRSRTKVRTPKTNGFVERFDGTVLDEFLRVKMRETLYDSVEALQADLDAWLVHYNTERPHLGCRNMGATAPRHRHVIRQPRRLRGHTRPSSRFKIIPAAVCTSHIATADLPTHQGGAGGGQGAGDEARQPEWGRRPPARRAGWGAASGGGGPECRPACRDLRHLARPLVVLTDEGVHVALSIGDVPKSKTYGAEGSLIILREGDPGEPEVTLSPLTYSYEHRAQAELFVDVGSGRHAAFDALKLELGRALALDRTLGGLCDWVEAGSPQVEELPVSEGGAPLKAATVLIRLHFATPDPLS